MEKSLSAGAHTLTIQFSIPAPDDSSVLLYDLHARIQDIPQVLNDNQSVKFVDERGNQFALRYSGILSLNDVYYLYTDWEKSDVLAFLDSEPCLDMFVHVLTPEGEQIGQADHLFGVHSLLAEDEIAGDGSGYSEIMDFIPLPPDISPNDSIRIGLWCPEDRSYFLNTTSATVDESGRLVLGTFETLVKGSW